MTAWTWIVALLASGCPAQDLVLADFNDGGIRRYDSSTGDFLGHFVEPGAGGLFNPTAMTFGDDGMFYVGIGSDTEHTVLRFDGATGAFVDAFIQGDANTVGAITDLVIHNDEIYVTEWRNTPRRGGVSVFDRDGNFVRRLTQSTNRFNAIAFDDGGRLFATDFDGGVVRELDPINGGIIGDIDGAGLNGPMQMRYGPDGLLYVTDWFSADVLRIDPRTRSVLGSFIDDDATEPNAQGLALAPDDSILLDNHFGNTVHRFDGQTGELIDTLIEDAGVTFLHRFEFMPACPGDLDGDGDGDADDFFAYLDAFAAWNQAVCDVDGDGDCDAEDFFAYLDLFVQPC